MKLRTKTLGYVEGWLSVLINTALFGVKFWVGNMFKSVAMVADAWHTLSDMFTSIVVILGFWIASRPADRKHPFGHGRAEGITAVAIATLLATVGFNFLHESIDRLRTCKAATFGTIAVVVFLASVLIKEALAQFSLWAAGKADSQSLRADAWHHRSDAIASALIVVGAFFCRSLWWIDGVMGIGVSLLILYAAFDILKASVSPLLGERQDSAVEQKITEAVRTCIPDEASIHHLHVHRYGDHCEVTLHVRLPLDMHVEEAHAIVTAAEQAIRERVNMEATVHVEPVLTEQNPAEGGGDSVS